MEQDAAKTPGEPPYCIGLAKPEDKPRVCEGLIVLALLRHRDGLVRHLSRQKQDMLDPGAEPCACAE